MDAARDIVSVKSVKVRNEDVTLSSSLSNEKWKCRCQYRLEALIVPQRYHKMYECSHV